MQANLQTKININLLKWTVIENFTEHKRKKNEFANCLRSDKEVILKEKRLDAVFIGLAFYYSAKNHVFPFVTSDFEGQEKKCAQAHLTYNFIRF